MKNIIPYGIDAYRILTKSEEKNSTISLTLGP